MLCPHCGTENPDASTTCSNCGELLSNSSDSADSSDGADSIDSTDSADGADSGDTLDPADITDSADTEDSDDEADSSGEADSSDEAEPDDSDNSDEKANSSLDESDNPPVFSPPTMSPFIGDDADGSIFQPSLLSDIDYSQFNVVTDGTVADGADIPTTLKKPRSSKAIKVVSIAVLAVALCIALAGGIWFLHL